jgi:hypothetical protein
MAYKSNAWDSKKSAVLSLRTDLEIEGDTDTNAGIDAIGVLPQFISKDCHIYVWCRWDCFTDFATALSLISKIKGVIVWDKGGPGLGDLECAYGDNEWAIYSIVGRRPLNERQNSVWQVNRMKGLQMDHPTQKPVELAERAIVNSSGSNSIVLDPFCGSGTTIIACENLSRRCRACEISPGYVGVALERYFQHTGVQPVLLESAAR